MKLIGDIGNTEIKICLIDNKFRIIKKINFQTNEINSYKIRKKLKSFLKNKKKIENIIFSSVVPNAYKQITKFLNLNLNKKII